MGLFLFFKVVLTGSHYRSSTHYLQPPAPLPGAPLPQAPSSGLCAVRGVRTCAVGTGWRGRDPHPRQCACVRGAGPNSPRP